MTPRRAATPAAPPDPPVAGHIAVLGAGSWGTAFSAILADGGNEVRLWGRRPELVEMINSGSNDDYLPGIALPAGIRATTDPGEALVGARFVVVAVPSQTLRANLGDWAPVWPSAPTPIVSLLKGIELETCKRMSEVIAEVTGTDPARIVAVTGPNLAREIAEGQPAASVVAGPGQAAVEVVAQACATGRFRPYTSRDIVGAELAGAVKNVVALAVGMAGGMGLGDNTKATIITRGLAETARLGAALGANPTTFMGLAGVGDLVATCDSPLSRNRTFGECLGQGMSVEQAQAHTRQTAEGVKSCRSVLELAQRNEVEMPITAGVVAVVAGRLSPEQVVDLLMSRARKAE